MCHEPEPITYRGEAKHDHELTFTFIQVPAQCEEYIYSTHASPAARDRMLSTRGCDHPATGPPVHPPCLGLPRALFKGVPINDIGESTNHTIHSHAQQFDMGSTAEGDETQMVDIGSDCDWDFSFRPQHSYEDIQPNEDDEYDTDECEYDQSDEELGPGAYDEERDPVRTRRQSPP